MSQYFEIICCQHKYEDHHGKSLFMVSDKSSSIMVYNEPQESQVKMDVVN